MVEAPGRPGNTSVVLRRFLARRLAVASLVVLLVVLLSSLVGGRLWRYGLADITDEVSVGPSWQHPMGTDGNGVDLLALVLRGAQKSVQVALLVALLSTTVGTLVGALAGYYRGLVDGLLMRATDLMLTIPGLAVLVVVAARVRESGSWLLVAVVLAFLAWAQAARVVRGVFLSLREREFVDAARALGAGDRRIIIRHLLPNAAGPIIVNATLTVAFAVLAETALSYLGLGIREPDSSLGLLVSRGQQAATTRPWLFYFPGLVILLITVTVNVVGDGIRAAFDPLTTVDRAGAGGE
ncbi:MAG: ABC transporter permease [Acidimicrobiales bacterium]